MRFGELIRRDMDPILDRWDVAATARMRATQRLKPRSLRNHARGILREIVEAMERPEPPDGGARVSLAGAAVASSGPPTAAQSHAIMRAEGGFPLEQLACDYSALRVSALHVWIEACRPKQPAIEDIIRFDEALDEALVGSIRLYAAHVSHARSMLLGMLSHDLRSPLGTVLMTARALRRLHTNADVDHAAELLLRSGARMQKLLDEQIDLSRVELGLGIGVHPRDVDLGPVCTDELEQIGAAHAECALNLEVTGDCSGTWDAGRFQQMLNNLVVNAVQYGEPHEEIQVSLHGAEAEVQLTVANAGETIDDETLARIFEPMRRGGAAASRHDSGLGLGLYIASEIAKAHGGAIAAESKGRKTVFTVHLPKMRSPPALT